MLVQENYKGAIDEYREALKIDPHLDGVHLGIGQALLAQGGQNALSAEIEFRAELAVDRGNPEALFQLGNIVYERGDKDGAARYFTEELGAAPIVLKLK